MTASRSSFAGSRPSEDELLDASRDGVRLAVSRGVTAVHDKDGWLGALRIFQRLHEEGSLLLRVWQSLPHAQVQAAAALGLRSGFGDDFLRLGYLKAFMDGTLGSQTARMLEGSGVEITSRAELEEIVRRGAAAGLPVAVHAIGDLANREALDAFEATRDVWYPLGLRPRIEHAQLLAPEDVPRFAAVGVAASVQFSHAGLTVVAVSASSKVSRCSGCQSRVTAATTPAQGSSSSIGASEPFATNVPASHSDRYA